MGVFTFLKLYIMYQIAQNITYDTKSRKASHMISVLQKLIEDKMICKSY